LLFLTINMIWISHITRLYLEPVLRLQDQY